MEIMGVDRPDRTSSKVGFPTPSPSTHLCQVIEAVTELYPQTLGWSPFQPLDRSGHVNSPGPKKVTFAEVPGDEYLDLPDMYKNCAFLVGFFRMNRQRLYTLVRSRYSYILQVGHES